MARGIVMEMTTHHVIVMTSDGQFNSIPVPSQPCAIGEEIEFAEIEHHAPPPAARTFRIVRSRYMSIAVACCMLLLATFGLFQSAMQANAVVAYVTLDINPSVEAGLNKKQKVVEVRAINEDGASLLQDLDYRGVPIDVFSEMLVDRLQQSHYLDSLDLNILIAGTIVSPQKKLNADELLLKVESKVTERIAQAAPNAEQVVTLSSLAVPAEIRSAAVEQGVSTGKMATMLLSQSTPQPIELEELKTKSVKELFAEHDDVGRLITSSDEQSKEQTKTILKEIAQAEQTKKAQAEQAKQEEPAKQNQREQREWQNRSEREQQRNEHEQRRQQEKAEREQQRIEREERKKQEQAQREQQQIEREERKKQEQAQRDQQRIEREERKKQEQAERERRQTEHEQRKQQEQAERERQQKEREERKQQERQKQQDTGNKQDKENKEEEKRERDKDKRQENERKIEDKKVRQGNGDRGKSDRTDRDKPQKQERR